MGSNQVIQEESQDGTWGYYNLLPDELKLEVLKHAIPQQGAHHFTVKIPEPDAIDQVLDIVPNQKEDAKGNIKLQKDDSAWLGIWNVSWTVGMSRELIAKHNVNRKKIWSREPAQTRPRKGASKKEEPNTAAVHTDRDLLIITVARQDFEISSLDPAQNRAKFHYVKKLGIDFFEPEQKRSRGADWTMGAYYCLCRKRPHRQLAVCPRALCDFMRLFGGLEDLFIIYPINKGRIDQKIQQGFYKRGVKRGRGGQVIKQRPKFVMKNVDVLMEDTMNKFQSLALKHNLAIFEDRKKVYYEVRKEDCEEFEDYDAVWGIVEKFRGLWAKPRVGTTVKTAQWEAWMKVNVRVLVCRASEGKDPWKVNAILNNEIKPAKKK